MRKGLAVAAGLLILIGVNWTIVQRERLLADGRPVLLELAPVDPRSLMQGDYMALRYRLAAEAFAGVDLQTAGDGYLLVALDEHHRAAFKRLLKADDGFQTAADEIKLRYRLRAGVVRFATNAFFFQEGTAAAYAKARFGEFRVADSGEMILIGLRDENLATLGKVAAAP